MNNLLVVLEIIALILFVTAGVSFLVAHGSSGNHHLSSPTDSPAPCMERR
jgi:hypothetical protein